MSDPRYRFVKFNSELVAKMEAGWAAEAHGAADDAYPYQYEIGALAERCRKSMDYTQLRQNAEYSYAMLGDTVDYPLAIVYMACTRYGFGERRVKMLNVECCPSIEALILAGDIASETSPEDPVQLLIDALHGAIDESFNGLAADTVKLFARNNDLLTVLKATATVLQKVPSPAHDVSIQHRWLVLQKKALQPTK